MRTGGVLLAIAVCSGCLSSSSYQTAKMLPQGATRVAAAVNNYEGHYTDPDNGDTSTYGLDGFEAMASHGVADNIEIGGKLALLDGPQANIYHIMAVPKISVVPDQLAIVAPSGVGIVGDSDSSNGDDGGHFFETLPGIVFSHALSNVFELTGAAQLIWLINDDFDDSEFYAGLNIGVRLRPPGAAWAIQPEIGFTTPITNRDESVDYIMQYGLAVHYEFGGAAAAASTTPVAPPPP